MKLKAEHLELEATPARVYVSPRRKGKGRRGVWLPLLPGAVRALKDFDKWEAYGRFSTSSMRMSFLRAVDKLNERRARHKRPPLDGRPYDLRHSFGTMLADGLQDDRAIQELMLHGTAQQTRRYTAKAAQARVSNAVATFLATWQPGDRAKPARTGRRRKDRNAENLNKWAPDRTRTCNLRLRRPTLYPVELRAHKKEGKEGGATLLPSSFFLLPF